jgi:hypothetical protein
MAGFLAPASDNLKAEGRVLFAALLLRIHMKSG